MRRTPSLLIATAKMEHLMLAFHQGLVKAAHSVEGCRIAVSLGRRLARDEKRTSGGPMRSVAVPGVAHVS
jgi:hypothetical protein